MIRRSMAELYESIRELWSPSTIENRVVGCVALHVFWADLAEIRCLAVAEHVQGLGVGRRLVDACWEMARELEIKSIFALTNCGRILRTLRLPSDRQDRSCLSGSGANAFVARHFRTARKSRFDSLEPESASYLWARGQGWLRQI